MELYETIRTQSGKAATTVIKHLKAVGVGAWEDLTREKLYELKDEIIATVPSSAPTIFSHIRCSIKRHGGLEGAEDYAEILQAKVLKPVHTFLTREELKAFEAVATHTKKEEIVKVQCLLEAYTGARISDIMCFTTENVVMDEGGRCTLTYTSKKTSTTATVPISQKTLEWIRYAQEHKDESPYLPSRERAIRRLARKAGITALTKVFRAGKTITKEKCDLLTSHSFRRTFVTLLVANGVSVADTARLAGHGNNITTTQRYICAYDVQLNDKALEILGI